MGDLSDVQSAGSTKIIGSDSTGLETTPVRANSSGDMRVSDVSSGGGVEGALTVGTTAVEVKVGRSALSNRVLVTLFNNSNVTIYWGYTSGVTTTTGTPLFKSQERGWACTPGTTIYVIAGSTNNNCRVTERAA